MILTKLAALGGGTALVLTVSACGGGPSSSVTTAATQQPSGAVTSGAGALPPATGEPIMLGLANDEGTAVNFPEYRIGAEAAVKHLNATGGVNGRPIKLILCKADGSPEGSINCANSFIDGKALAYVAGLDVGSDAALPALKSAGLPYITPTAWGIAQGTDPDAFDLHTASDAFSVGAIKALADGGAKRIANFHYAIPHSVQAEPAYNAAAKKFGSALFHVQVPPQGADWSTAVNTALAQKADAMIGFFNESDCTNLVRAARTAGFTGPIAAGSCSDYVKKLGAQADNTLSIADRYPADLRDSAPPAVQAQLDEYSAAMKDYGKPELTEGLARNSFSMMMELAQVMKGVSGPLTASSLTTALRGITDAPGYFGPNLKCSGSPWKAQPRACSAEVLVIKTVKSGGGVKREPVGNGFVDLSGLG